MVAFTSGRLRWMPAAASARQPAVADTFPGTVSAVRSGVRASIQIRWLISDLNATHLQLHLGPRLVPLPEPISPKALGWPPRRCRKAGGFGRAVARQCRAIEHSGNQIMPATDTPHLPPTFNRLAWSNLAAQSAEQIALAAAPIVAVLLLGVGEGQTGLLQTALTLPFVLFAIPAGLLADRMSRRLLMARAEALRAAALAGILLLIWLGWMTLPLLALLGFIAVCGTVAYSVAAPALVPSLVNPQQLPAANARIELARTVAFASGPALGGILVGWVGA